MAVWRFVDFSIPEAQRLADLAGVVDDLRAVESLCDAFIALPEPLDVLSIHTREALCSAALVRYGRVFATGVRSGVTAEQREKLNPEHQEWHHFYKSLRDKWIAHSVNAFEENHVVAYLVPPKRGQMQVCSVNVQRRRVSCLSKNSMAALKQLAEALRRIIEADVEVESERVLALARAVPPEDLYTKERDQSALPGSTDVGKPRPKFSDA